MKHISLIIISLLFFTACSDSIENIESTPVDNNDTGLNLNFSLKNASDPILAVTGKLSSTGKPDNNFDFSVVGDVASYSLEHIDAGTWTLDINAFANVDKSAASLRYNGQKEFTVVAGQRTTVAITLNPTTGELDVTVSWGYTGSMNLTIDLANQDPSIVKYSYSLMHATLPGYSADLAVASGAEKIIASLNDVPEGDWNILIHAKNVSDGTVETTGSVPITIIPGLITVLLASHGQGFVISVEEEPNVAGKAYIADEALRQYLIQEKGFSDLREPYILNSDAGTVQFLDLNYEGTFFKYAKAHSKGFGNQLNLDVISAFTNLRELKLLGFNLNKLVTDNNPNLLNVELNTVSAQYADFSGAPNLVALSAYASIYWIDISQNTSLQFLNLNQGIQKEIQEGLNYEPNFYNVIGAVYIDQSMYADEAITQSGYGKFVDSSFDTDSMTIAIPDDDAKRALLAYNFVILKSNTVLKGQTDNMEMFYYPYENNGGCKGCGKQKGFGGLFTYQPLYSMEVIKLFPNLTHLELSDQRFAEIDLSMNPLLVSLYLNDNEVLTSLDISANPLLGGGNYKQKISDYKSNGKFGKEGSEYRKSLNKEYSTYGLYIEGSFLLESITIGTHNDLIQIDISDTKLTSIDLSGMPSLEYAYLYNNQLSSINFGSVNLYELDLSYNQFTNINVSSNTLLNDLYLDGNLLTSIDVSNLTGLDYFYIDNNNLDSLDVSGLTTLFRLHAEFNNLAFVNLTGTTNLYYLYLNDNKLTSIDLSSAANMNNLNLQNNLLTGTLNISPMRAGYGSPSPFVYTTGNTGLVTIQYDDNCNNQSIANVSKDIGTTYTQLGCKQ